jgi:hypothetical protein
MRRREARRGLQGSPQWAESEETLGRHMVRRHFSPKAACEMASPTAPSAGRQAAGKRQMISRASSGWSEDQAAMRVSRKTSGGMQTVQVE